MIRAPARSMILANSLARDDSPQAPRFRPRVEGNQGFVRREPSDERRRLHDHQW
jgi:hypothetical protein